MSLRNTVLAVLTLTLALPVGWDSYNGMQLVSVALADDDDDDDDDDRDSRSRSRSFGSRERDRSSVGGRESHEDIRKLFRSLTRKADSRKKPAAPRRSAPRRQAAPVVAPPPQEAYAPDEVISVGLQPEHLSSLTASGFSVLRTTRLGEDRILHRLRKPAAMTLPDALAQVRTLAPMSDMNHFYRSESDPLPAMAASCNDTNCLARDMIAWPEDTSCGTPPTIGMIDTGINAGHTVFEDASLTVHRLEMEAAQSGLMHGTSIASLLVGDTESRSPGLVPHMPVLAVDAFYSDGKDERSDGFSLVRALDWLVENEARVINLSLAGDDNMLVAQKIAEVEAKGIMMIAAAGNNGPTAKPAYPAAYEGVLAVTAVDRRGQVYRRANRGEHIDLAAPGVEVWTAASISGARTKTGTSFAAPFVTAAAALHLQSEPDLTLAELREKLTVTAHDLGDEGPDAIYGSGLIIPPQICQ